MPFPATRVIPDGWSEHHQPTTEDAMTGECRITVPSTGDGTYNDPAQGGDGTTTPPAPRTIASAVPCRVQATQGTERVVLVGDQTVTLRTYRVSIPADTATVPVGATVTLTDCPNDEDLQGEPLEVLDVLHGTEVWQRDLLCQHNLG